MHRSTPKIIRIIGAAATPPAAAPAAALPEAEPAAAPVEAEFAAVPAAAELPADALAAATCFLKHLLHEDG